VADEYKEHSSPTGHLIDGQLVPVPESVAATETVWLALPIEDGQVQVWEGLAAEPTKSPNRVKLRAVPLFAYDVNYGDEISVVISAEGPLVATGVTKDSGNYTFRVWLREDAGDAALRDVVTQFGALGCLIEGYGNKLIGLSCSPENAQQVAHALEVAEHEGRRFTYETGRQRTS
jgi:hypothetical protein